MISQFRTIIDYIGKQKMKGTTFFISFLRQLIKTAPYQSPHFSSNRIIQSSVGVIFKYSSKDNNTYNSIDKLIQNWKQIDHVSLLMAQRSGYEKDANAYNVVFPGGHAEFGESDLQACKRELMEEISLDTDHECLYVGQIPKNFYYAKKRGKIVYISCHVWILKPQSSFQPKLNTQLIDYRWVPISQLLQPTNLTIFSQRQLGFFNRMGVNIINESIKKNLQSVQFPGMNVSLKRDLWGLTLWLLGYILQMSKYNMVNNPNTELMEQQKQIIKNIDIIINSLKMLKIKFKSTYIMGYPMIGAAKFWLYFFRVRPFTYVRPKPQRNVFPLVIASFIVSILILLKIVLT